MNCDTHISRRQIFRELLTALWLRPESALWYSHMLSAARSLGVHALPSPSMEFGCMDGLNALVLLGGKVSADFDVFSDVRWSHDAHRKSTLASDYYDHVNIGSDDHWRRNTPPPSRFDWGLDWKESHLDKARRLRAHEQFVLWRPGQPMAMFEDDYFNGIWAPNLYWMDDVNGVLREFSRVTRPTGTIVTIVPDRRLLDHMLYPFASDFNKNWAQDLDRGRYENASRSASTYEDWRERIDAASLQITAHAPFIPAVIGEMYEVGFRPMFAALMNMYEKLKRNNPAGLLHLKRTWMEAVDFYLAPFVDDVALAKFGEEHLWHIFALRPSK